MLVGASPFMVETAQVNTHHRRFVLAWAGLTNHNHISGNT